MRASQERLHEQETRARSASHNSSEKRKIVRKDFIEDSAEVIADLNDREFGGTDQKGTIQSRKGSIKLTRDVSAQAIVVEPD